MREAAEGGAEDRDGCRQGAEGLHPPPASSLQRWGHEPGCNLSRSPQRAHQDIPLSSFSSLCLVCASHSCVCPLQPRRHLLLFPFASIFLLVFGLMKLTFFMDVVAAPHVTSVTTVAPLRSGSTPVAVAPPQQRRRWGSIRTSPRLHCPKLCVKCERRFRLRSAADAARCPPPPLPFFFF